MKEESTTINGARPKPEHGTIRSYVIGFILSLVFTLVPYYMVVEKSFAGSWLIAAILAFAFVQLIVQVFFFLHLGREKKPYWQANFLVSTVFAVLVVIVGSVLIMYHLHRNMDPGYLADKVSESEAIYQISGKLTGTCPGDTGETHKVTLTNELFIPSVIDARQCDSILFINESDSTRVVMFGTFDDMREYAGESSLNIRSGRNKSVLLTETGTHQFHDHQNQNVSGHMIVSP